MTVHAVEWFKLVALRAAEVFERFGWIVSEQLQPHIHLTLYLDAVNLQRHIAKREPPIGNQGPPGHSAMRLPSRIHPRRPPLRDGGMNWRTREAARV